MVSISHIEHIVFPLGIEVEFYYDCKVDFNNIENPVKEARLTGDQVYKDGAKLCKWDELPGLHGLLSNYHDWSGFDSRVIERASYQHEFNKAA